MPTSCRPFRPALPSLLPLSQCRLHHLLQCRDALFAKTNKAFHYVPLSIEYEGLRNALIHAHVVIDKFFVGENERVRNPKFFGERGHFRAIVFTADIRSDNLESFRFVLLLQGDQMRGLYATRIAPRRVKIQKHDLAFVIRQLAALAISQRPSAG